MHHKSFLHIWLASLALACVAGCGANSEGSASAASMAVPSVGSPDLRQPEQTKTEEVMTAFIPALGSQGNGAVMTELKSHGGHLREPEAKYDVYDTSSTADLKTLKQSIQASLDRDRNVLIDSDGTPESREKAAQMSYEAIGASLPDVSSALIRRVPEEQGGGFALIPIYTNADVAVQIAQGKISDPASLNNSVDNFFFKPSTPKP